MSLAHYLAQSSDITNEVNGIVTILLKKSGHSENLSNFHRSHSKLQSCYLNQPMFDKMYN